MVDAENGKILYHVYSANQASTIRATAGIEASDSPEVAANKQANFLREQGRDAEAAALESELVRNAATNLLFAVGGAARAKMESAALDAQIRQHRIFWKTQGNIATSAAANPGSDAPINSGPAASKPAVPEAGPTPNKTSSPDRNYIFRGDDNFRGGAVGKPLGAEANAADIQSFADHVLRKESGTSSRFTSFTTETKVAKKFTSAPDFRSVTKAEMEALQDLEAKGIIKIHTPDSVYEAMKAGPKKLSKEASAVRDAMKRNGEILIEGQIPEGVLQKLK